MEEEAEASYGGRGEDSMLSPREESSSWDWEGTRLEELLPQALVLSLCVVCVLWSVKKLTRRTGEVESTSLQRLAVAS
jgi:hypothetical protein